MNVRFTSFFPVFFVRRAHEEQKKKKKQNPIIEIHHKHTHTRGGGGGGGAYRENEVFFDKFFFHCKEKELKLLSSIYIKTFFFF